MKVDYEVFRKILNSLINEQHYNKSPDDIFEDVFGHQTDAERLFGDNTPRMIKFWGHMFLLQDLGLLDFEGRCALKKEGYTFAKSLNDPRFFKFAKRMSPGIACEMSLFYQRAKSEKMLTNEGLI